MASRAGGPPVSLAAIKGFAASWLFPRTVIVIGSLASVVFLGMQTIIINSQTTLLRQQAIAAQTEQAERLRSRVVRIAQLSLAAENHKNGNESNNQKHAECSLALCPRDVPLQDRLKSGNETPTSAYIKSLLMGPVPHHLLKTDYEGAGDEAEGIYINRFQQGNLAMLNNKFLDDSIIECLAVPLDILILNKYLEKRIELRAAFFTDRSNFSATAEKIFTHFDARFRGLEKTPRELTLSTFEQELQDVDHLIDTTWTKIQAACDATKNVSRQKLLALDKQISMAYE